MAISQGRVVGSPIRSPTVAPQQRKKLTAAEKRTPEGRFALRLQQLLDERGWGATHFAGLVGVDPRIGKALDAPGHPFPDWRLVIPADL
jgi:hypothetical protein